MTISREALREELLKIRENGCKVPENVNAYELALLMTDYLGDIDSELRDNLVYTVLNTWVVEAIFSKEQQRRLLAILLDDKHLFYRLGEQNTESVFMRAFSILIIGALVYRHRQDAYIERDALIDVKNKMLEYMKLEKDVRGHVEIGGWAHTAAHSADAIDEVALCEEFGAPELLEILQAIKKKVCIDYHAYICYEDERLSIATTNIIERNILSEEKIADWIKSFAEFDKKTPFPNQYYLLSNMRNYLNSVYYRLPAGKYPVIKIAISDTIQSIRRF